MNYTLKSFSTAMGSTKPDFASRWEETFGKKNDDTAEEKISAPPVETDPVKIVTDWKFWFNNGFNREWSEKIATLTAEAFQR